MSLSRIHRAILDLTIEDSYDLLEVQSHVQEILSMSETENVTQAVQANVRQLFVEGLLSVWKARELGGEEELLPPDEAARALADNENWTRPEVGFPRIRILATEAGERAYYSSQE